MTASRDGAVIYVDLDDLLAAARAVLRDEPRIRDVGLLLSALARPQAEMYGVAAYPEFDQKAAALLISVTNNRALIDGNKRLGWVAVRLFYLLNGCDLAMPRDVAFELVMGIADGSTRDVGAVAKRLAPHVVRGSSPPRRGWLKTLGVTAAESFRPTIEGDQEVGVAERVIDRAMCVRDVAEPGAGQR